MGAMRAAVSIACLLLAAAGARAQESATPATPRAEPARTAADSIRYAVAVTDIARVGLTVTNYGFFGNNFNSRAPSLEFPLGSGYEHMSRAGLWIGAHAVSDTGAFTGVSCAIVDEAQGTSSASETEFTPAGIAITQRSRIQNSRYFSKDAISDQDLECTYSDNPPRAPSGYQQERHTPLDILVKQQILGFSLKAAQDIEFVRFTIRNLGPPLRAVWVGMYGQFVSGDKNSYSTWPPSASSSPNGSWYYKVHFEYDTQRRLYKEHFCRALPYPDGCAFGIAPPWAGLKLLRAGNVPLDSSTVLSNWWSWTPGDPSRSTDVLRYALMSSGTSADPSTCVPGTSCSPIELLSVGPFTELDAGDSLQVDFAFLGGDDEAGLLASADYAQFASDKNYVLPEPPPSPRDTVVAREGGVDIYWDDSPESAVDPTSPNPHDFEGYRVYIGEDRQHPALVSQYDVPGDTSSFNSGFAEVRLPQPVTLGGTTYQYKKTIRGLRDGFKYFASVTAFDTGTPEVEPLESSIGLNKKLVVPAPAPAERPGGPTVFPNPYRVEARWDSGRLVRDHYVWFANLPERCRLRVYTLSGDVVLRVEFDGRSYHGDNARGLYDPKREFDLKSAPALSGSSYAWNLITDRGQAVATGLYLWAVEDRVTGKRTVGKLLIVKSDLESF